MPCIMAAWKCIHNLCRASKGCTQPVNHTGHQVMHTSNPVIVCEKGKERHILASEAESAMGMPHGYTSVATDEAGHQYAVSDWDRRQRIGMAIDVRQLKHLLSGVQTNRPKIHDCIAQGKQSDAATA